ncbi:hypothetical protein C8F01DRAFT_1371316 [Mycena amicta]|nr:hypothetical protein C8F01DRAFT_1371316 [Mycena amicta]
MRFNFASLAIILATGSQVYASTGALGFAGRRELELVARSATTATGTSTVTKSTTGSTSQPTGSSGDCCECLVALAAEGVACAAAFLEGCLNPLANIGCILDYAGASLAVVSSKFSAAH